MERSIRGMTRLQGYIIITVLVVIVLIVAGVVHFS